MRLNALLRRRTDPPPRRRGRGPDGSMSNKFALRIGVAVLHVCLGKRLQQQAETRGTPLGHETAHRAPDH